MFTIKIELFLLVALTLFCPSFAHNQVDKAIQPYLLPSDHQLKPALDFLFKRSRVTFNDVTIKKAGFQILFRKSRSFIRVLRHHKLPGYLIKANLDTTSKLKNKTPAWKWLVRRCQGAKKIRQVIAREGLIHFQAPQKWLYKLPDQPFPNRHFFHKQPVVLLVEDMKLVSSEENEKAWKTKITLEHLDELYLIIKHAGGSSYRPDNIWLSKNGKFSFVDTEYPYLSRKFDRIQSFLSSSNQRYWKRLIRQKGPKAKAVTPSK
jgi:hypothetical protein